MSEYYLLVDSSGQATEIKGETKIGRSKTSDLVLTDPLASRHHATVYYDGDVLMIRDEQSVNGTLVNRGQIYDPIALKDRDKVQFGDEVFTVRAPLAEAATLHKPKKDSDDGGTALTAKDADQPPLPISAVKETSEPLPISPKQAGSNEQKSSNRKILIIAGVSLLVLCLCCIVAVVVIRSMGGLNIF